MLKSKSKLMQSVEELESINALDRNSTHCNRKNDNVAKYKSFIESLNLLYSSSEYLLREVDLKSKSRVKYLDYKSSLSVIKTLTPFLEQIAKHLKIESELKFKKLDREFDIYYKNHVEDNFSCGINQVSILIEEVLNIIVYSFESKYTPLQSFFDKIVLQEKYYTINLIYLISNRLNENMSRMRVEEYKNKKYSFVLDYYINLDHGFITYIKSLTQNIFTDILFENLRKN